MGGQGGLSGLARSGGHGFNGHHMAISASEDIFDASLEDQFATIHNRDPITDLLDLPEQMGTQHHRFPFIAHRMDHSTDGG
jgi:hypothetical protein